MHENSLSHNKRKSYKLLAFAFLDLRKIRDATDQVYVQMGHIFSMTVYAKTVFNNQMLRNCTISDYWERNV